MTALHALEAPSVGQPRQRALSATANAVAKRGPTYRDIAGEQEHDLVRRYKAGDREAGGALLVAYDGFIHSCAKYHLGRGVAYDDLLQEARLGFLDGVAKFDASMGARLVAYAGWWARSRAWRYIEDHRSDVRIPVHAQVSLRAARKAGALTPSEIEAVAGEHVAWASAIVVESIDADDRDSDAGPLASVADEAPLPDEALSEAEESKRDAALVPWAMKVLSQREREVLRRRYLAEDGEEETLREIGERLGVSRERVRQIEEGALGKLRARIEKSCAAKAR